MTFRVVCQGMEVFADLLPGLQIRDLNLEQNNLGMSGVSALAQAARASETLQCLNLNSNGIADEGIQAIARLFLNIPVATLKDPDAIRAKLIEIYKEKNPEKLKTVDFLVKQFEGQEAEMFKLLEEKYGCLDDTTKPPPLQVLELADNRISCAGIPHVRTLCTSIPTIVSLQLSDNLIADDGAELIGAIMRDEKRLTDLNLDNNSITERGLFALLQAAKECQSLSTLSLSGNELGSVAMNWLVSSSAEFIIDEMEFGYKLVSPSPSKRSPSDNSRSNKSRRARPDPRGVYAPNPMSSPGPMAPGVASPQQ